MRSCHIGRCVPIKHWEEAAFYSFLEGTWNDRELPVGAVPLSRKYDMAGSTTTCSNAAESPTQAPYIVFLIQVSRPGLWTTTALFYLMPLGHRDVFHYATFWLGLFFVLFPLGLLLYGANDIVDAEADRYNPRKGTFLFGSRGAREQLAALRWQIALAQIP